MTLLATILPWAQIILAIILIVSILVQHNEAGLGASFGGSGGGDSIQHTRRGFEKTIFTISIITAILFGLSAIVRLFIA